MCLCVCVCAYSQLMGCINNDSASWLNDPSCWCCCGAYPLSLELSSGGLVWVLPKSQLLLLCSRTRITLAVFVRKSRCWYYCRLLTHASENGIPFLCFLCMRHRGWSKCSIVDRRFVHWKCNLRHLSNSSFFFFLKGVYIKLEVWIFWIRDSFFNFNSLHRSCCFIDAT